MNRPRVINPDWPVPANVQAIVTTRNGGISEAPYQSFNLAKHVGDSALAVAGNRDILREELPSRLTYQWLDQIHSADVAVIENSGPVITADGLITREPDIACCVLTADCLPLMFANSNGSEIAIVHGGWRGLVEGILENTVSALESSADELIVWLGPAIGPCHYEVGDEIRQEFLNKCSKEDGKEIVDRCFVASDKADKLQFNLFEFARLRLAALGIKNIHGGESCTHCDDSNFYSYRRDGATGRMASIIYFTEDSS